MDITVDFDAIMADGLILDLRNTSGPLEVESLALFHWVFRGGIYREDGSPARHHEAVVDFNRTLMSLPSPEPSDQTD